MWEDRWLLEHAFGWRPKMARMKSYVGLSGSKVLKDSGLRVLFTWHRDTDGVCDQIQSAGLVSVPKWMPRKSTSCLCRACPSLPGRTVVKWVPGHDRNIWEVKDSTGSHGAQLCRGRYSHWSSARSHHHEQGSFIFLWVPFLVQNEGSQKQWTLRLFLSLKF